MAELLPAPIPPLGPIGQQCGAIPGTAKIVLAGASYVTQLVSTMLPPGAAAKLAIGGSASTTHRGVVCAVESIFTAGSPSMGTAEAKERGILINHLQIRKDDNGELCGGPNGEVVFGLLQAANGSSDGDDINDNPGGYNLQVSFVYHPLGNPTGYTNHQLPAGTYVVNFPILILGNDADYAALLNADRNEFGQIPRISGAGNPNGVRTGFRGQRYTDTDNGIEYRCTADGSQVWTTF